ncbi:uncharacterized protein LOC128133607 [Lactuca sativa]|uniref:uncharacterized protein LOC128133607 n=2 Tax=Lactuca sativa TaxID=4236 RepID=UPI0022AF10A6|nr:uncharacterized protein LOC128133607 [Lactuca sativa]
MATVESLLLGSGTSHPPSSAFNPKAKAAAAFPETAPGLNPRAIMSFAQDLEQVTLFILIIEVELMKYCEGFKYAAKSRAKIQKKEGIPWHQQILIIDGKILEDEVVVSPPFVFLTSVKSELRPEIQVAAQNCWVKKGGAFTGEVSAEMLANLGVPWVILGHSERRALLNETNEFVGDKVAYALSQGLKVIACVGETLEQREAGTTMEVVAAQTKAIAGNYFKTKLASTVCQKSKILFYL